MRVAVIRFPGSNCDQDALHALRDDVGVAADYVWHNTHSLDGFDAVFLPGGFSYGDYLRCGAIAARAAIMGEVQRFAREGRPVLGVCNGFQVLCESGILPGALMQNSEELFICKTVSIHAVNRTSAWTQGVNTVLQIPVAHGEGRYVVDEATLGELEARDQIAFRYCTPEGKEDASANINGSTHAIAGVLNEAGNVLGMMPHPERCTRAALGMTDGLAILRRLAG